MKPIRKPRLSPIEQRKQQLAKQIDELRQQAATKTQKSFKTDKGCPCCEKHGLHLRDKRVNSPFPAETGSLIKLQAREKFNSLPEA
jgi:hypothetical protein